jgi:hypothetical protein
VLAVDQLAVLVELDRLAVEEVVVVGHVAGVRRDLVTPQVAVDVALLQSFLRVCGGPELDGDRYVLRLIHVVVIPL